MEKRPESAHFIVNRALNTPFSYQGWPSLCRDENGTLYAVASGFRTQHICPFGKTVMYVSRDEGQTWTPPIVINDTYLDDRDAGILYMGNGKMLVSWFSHSAKAYHSQYFDAIKNSANRFDVGMAVGALQSYPMIPSEYASGGSFVRMSDDYGVTWSETVKLPISAPHGPNLLSDGSLLYLGKDMYITEDNNNTYGHIRAMKSRDGGYTWDELAILDFPERIGSDAFHEPHVVELESGRLFGAIRAQGGKVAHGFTIYTTYSDDGGRTWSPMKATGVSGSPPHLLVHSSGALICSYARREKPYSQRAMVSYDGGESWRDDYVIDDRAPNGDIGYPATVELDDHSLVSVYYQKIDGDQKCSIHGTRWSL